MCASVPQFELFDPNLEASEEKRESSTNYVDNFWCSIGRTAALSEGAVFQDRGRDDDYAAGRQAALQLLPELPTRASWGRSELSLQVSGPQIARLQGTSSCFDDLHGKLDSDLQGCYVRSSKLQMLKVGE
jgi:hypothetical protein